MKHLLFFLLGTFFVFSQSDKDRIKIRQSINLQGSLDLDRQNLLRTHLQDSLKADYIAKHNLSSLESRNLKAIYNGIPFFFKEDNAGSSRTIGGNKLYPGGSLGLSVTGSGMTAGEWDGGKVRNTHQELTGRVTLGDAASSLSEHATHVAGTIMASGVQTSAKGIAYQASLKSYDWDNDTSEVTSFANAGFLVSNHSYGYVATDLPAYFFGKYNSDAAIIDNIAYNYPYYQMVKSAGNDRNDTSIGQVAEKEGYDLLTGECNAKNVISVAAINEILVYTNSDDVVMSSFSNYGPSDDGRIKPDISAKGVSVYSSVSASNSSYSTFQGTSMASPSITGLIVLLQKHYNNVNPGNFMRSASLRGLLDHTAREAGGDLGPDYSFGWGVANGLEAAKVITNNGISSIFQEKVLDNGAVFQQDIAITTAQDIKVTISWTDPAAPANNNQVLDDRTPALVNNLDLKVLKDGVIYYPWKLNPEVPSTAATNDSDNDVDNVEKVEIFDAQPGVYTISVAHKGTLVNGSQNYTLIASGTNVVSLNTKDYDYDNSIFIYPNPAKGILNYTISDQVILTAITINDISGKVIFRNNNAVVPSQIDVSNLSSGVYFVTFKSDTSSLTKKFIKQ